MIQTIFVQLVDANNFRKKLHKTKGNSFMWVIFCFLFARFIVAFDFFLELFFFLIVFEQNIDTIDD